MKKNKMLKDTYAMLNYWHGNISRILMLGADMKSELKNCPFCGKEAKGAWCHDLYTISCDDACCHRSGFTEEEAVKEWNTRVGEE